MKTYKTIQVNKKQIRLHRYIMQCFLQRELKENELVHHKDGNIFNNNIDNLELTTRSEHIKVHNIAGYKTFKHKYNKKLISDLYRNKRLSGKQISVIIGVPVAAVCHYIRKNNIKRKQIYCKCGAKVRYTTKRQCSKCYLKDYYKKC